MKKGIVRWRSPSNIALVKYWGKKGIQLPANPSVSMTLSNCYSETEIEYNATGRSSGPGFRFYFHGKANELFSRRVGSFIDKIKDRLPVLRGLEFSINSVNSFPHSSGIASSASAISSLSLCLNHISLILSGKEPDENFFRDSSLYARLGSGSASRSVYGGYVLWGRHDSAVNSSDDYAVPLKNNIHSSFNDYYDAILVVDPSEKKVGSTEGHELMNANPYREVRAKTAVENTGKLVLSLGTGDTDMFRETVEKEAAALHAMFLTSVPPFIMVIPASLEIINKLVDFRYQTGTEFSITLDAGPNIHLLYPAYSREDILYFIKNELTAFCRSGKWIDDRIGKGPELIYADT